MSTRPDPTVTALVEVGRAVEHGRYASAAQIAAAAGLHEVAGRLVAVLLQEAPDA